MDVCGIFYFHPIASPNIAVARFSPPGGAGLVTDISSILTKAQRRQFTWQDLKQMKGSDVNLQVYAVPYSEHSSFFELTCFALSIEWEKMIATVNIGSEASRAKMNQWFERWKKEKAKRKEPVVQYRDIDYW
jgi:DNA cross-link repair 1A protein